jgi:hypothetical protein
MWPATSDWKAAVLKIMEDKKISRAELSRRCRASDAAISILFRPETETSRLVPYVHKALGLPPPAMMPIFLDQQRATLEAVWPNLSDDDKRLIVDTAIKFSLRK